MFKETFHIFHSQCDASGRVKLDVFQEMILNTACSAAEAGGFGIPVLNRMGKTWVMARFQMHVNTYPRIGDDVVIETWIEQNRMGFSMRNFRVSVVSCQLSVVSSQLSVVSCQSSVVRSPGELKTENCEQKTEIAVARSAWAVIDLKTRENVNFADLPDYPAPEGGTVELPPMPRPDRQAATTSTLHTIRYSDLDQNGHCNSSRYLQMMVDAYGSEQGLFPRDLIISYSHEIFFGEEATVRHSQGDAPFFAVYSPSGTLSVTAHFVL